MTKLSIVLSGVIEKSNFDEWKSELIEQIRSVNTELKTDDDFVAAGKHVKQFKAAEKSLKVAKKSALEQAAEINKLFEAIDTVSEEARQARLTLDKQIKRRKKEIKSEYVAQGVDSIKAFIATQSDTFQLLSHSEYNDKAIFVDVLSGKASSKGMQKAITKTCEAIKAAITKQANEVQINSTKLDNLPAHHQTLFQDRVQLIALSTEQLDKTINERVNHFEKLSKDTQAAPAAAVDEPEAPVVTEEKVAMITVDDDDASLSDYTITIEINATEQEADSIRTKVVEAVSTNSAVGNIILAAG